MAFIQPPTFRGILVQLCAQAPEAVECETLEIKGWCNDEKDLADKVSEAAACLANATGGVLLVGIGEHQDCRRKFSCCPHPNVNPAWLTARIHDLTVPPVQNVAYDISDMASEVVGVNGIQVFALDVPRTKFVSGHMTVKGLSKIRVGKECRPYYTAEDDRTRTHIPDVTVEDLSVTSIRWAIAQHRKKFQTPEAEWLEPWDFLVQARLLEPLQPNTRLPSQHLVPVAALILFGKQAALLEHLPFFETIVITRNGERRLHKNVVDCVQELCGSEHSFVPALCPGIPRATIQELLVNAYVHRCYRTSAPVVIEAAPSALEIQNPGELLGGLNVENLIHCVPVYRNLSLADGARFIGLCDKIGRGIDLVYESVLSGGFDFPIFESHNNLFTARINLERSREFAEFLRR